MNYMATNRAGDILFGDVSFDDFLRMSTSDLTQLQLKITYIGEQRKPLPTIVIRSEEAPQNDPVIDSSKVLALRVAGIDFGNDDLTPMFCTAKNIQLLQAIKNLSGIPTVASAVGAARYDGIYYGKYLALGLYNAIGEKEYRISAYSGSQKQFRF